METVQILMLALAAFWAVRSLYFKFFKKAKVKIAIPIATAINRHSLNFRFPLFQSEY